jgi:hypothetical protein
LYNHTFDLQVAGYIPVLAHPSGIYFTIITLMNTKAETRWLFISAKLLLLYYYGA